MLQRLGSRTPCQRARATRGVKGMVWQILQNVAWKFEGISFARERFSTAPAGRALESKRWWLHMSTPKQLWRVQE